MGSSRKLSLLLPRGFSKPIGGQSVGFLPTGLFQQSTWEVGSGQYGYLPAARFQVAGPRVWQAWETPSNSHHAAPGFLPGASPHQYPPGGRSAVGNTLFPPSRGTPGLPPGAPSHQNNSGRMTSCGNYFPWPPHIRVPARVLPPLIIHQYICFTLYKHKFIGPFEKRDRKKVRNKIQNKYHSMRNRKRG